MFNLHRRLQEDCILLGRLELCWLLLMNDQTYPWFILVPERSDVTEIHQLPDLDQWQLVRESSALARAIEIVFKPDKLNIAAIGNLVPQLHVHHVARRLGDPTWPGVVWGSPRGVPYALAEVERIQGLMGDRLGALLRPNSVS